MIEEKQKCALIYDLLKKSFRSVDETNFNDDCAVGLLFLERDAISVIERYYKIVGYCIIDDLDSCYPIDIHGTNITIFEGTYNHFSKEFRRALDPYIKQDEPQMKFSEFFYRWQFLGDWNVFENSGSFIAVVSKILNDQKLKSRVITENLNIIFPVNYEELSAFAQKINSFFCVDFYNKVYYEDINYLLDSLLNGYHINMDEEEISNTCYQLCSIVLEGLEENDV